MSWIIAIAFVVALVAALAASWVVVGMRYARDEKDDAVYLDIKALFGIVHIRKVFPMVKFDGLRGIILQHRLDNRGVAGTGRPGQQRGHLTYRKLHDYYRETRKLVGHVDGFGEWQKKALASVHVERVAWKTFAGTGDAVETALACGTIWAIKSTLLGFALKRTQLRQMPELTVIPMFDQELFCTEMVAKARVRFLQMAILGIALARRILRVRGGYKTWRSFLLALHKPEGTRTH